MNKSIKLISLTSLIVFLGFHYLVMSITKENFPAFTYFYPSIAKIWFEAGRLLLFFNIQIDLTLIFTKLRYIFLVFIGLTLFAFKYPSFYRITLWLASFFFGCYLLGLIFLGLENIYPLYTSYITCSFIIFTFILLQIHLIKPCDKN